MDTKKYDDTLNFFINNTTYKKEDVKKIIKIKNGFTNESYCLVLNNKQKFLIRFVKNHTLNRKIEKLIYERLNIKLIYFNDNGDLIRNWVDGKHFKNWNENKLDLFVKELSKINALEIDKLPKFDPYIFFNLLDKQKDEAIINEYNELVKKHQHDSLCTCHSDLNPNNILFNSKLNKMYLIDFEWIKKNNIYWELANFAREKLNKKQMLYLLNAYGLDDYSDFKDYLIITSLYAYQWTLSVMNSKKIIKYRNHVLKRLKMIRELVF